MVNQGQWAGWLLDYVSKTVGCCWCSQSPRQGWGLLADLFASGFLGNKLEGGGLVQEMWEMYRGDSQGPQLGEREGNGTGRGRR